MQVYVRQAMELGMCKPSFLSTWYIMFPVDIYSLLFRGVARQPGGICQRTDIALQVKRLHTQHGSRYIFLLSHHIRSMFYMLMILMNLVLFRKLFSEFFFSGSGSIS